MGAFWGRQVNLDELEESAPLSASLLTQLGVHPDCQNEVMAALKAKGIGLWGHLLAVKSCEQMEAYAEDEINGATIWNAIETKLRKRARSEEARESKRIRLVVPASERYTASDFIHEVSIRRTDIDFDSADVIDFKMQLWAHAWNQTFLLKRRSSVSMACSIVDEFLRRRPTIILAGAKGVGKSCECVFILSELTKRNKAFLLETNREKMLVIAGQKAFENCQEALINIFKRFKDSPPSKAGVYTFDWRSQDVFYALCRHPSFVHIVDIGDTFKDIIDVGHSQIIISGPNSPKLARTGEVDEPSVYYLDLWSREEMESLNERLAFPTKDGGYRYLFRKTEEDLKELMRMLGPNPYQVFKNRTVEEAAHYIEREVRDMPFETWRRVLNGYNYTNIPKLPPGVLVQITEHESSKNRCKVRFAFNYVARIVVKRFLKSHKDELIQLAKDVRGEKRLAYQLRNEMLQQRMHEALQNQPCTWTLVPLMKSGTGVTQHEFQVPPLVLKEFSSKELLDLYSLAENDLCVATVTTLPSVESFLITKRRSLGIDEDGLCVAGLQATISSSHRIERKGLIDIAQHCRRVLGLREDELPIYVIFVTTKSGIQKRQMLGAFEEPFDEQVHQFVCTDVDFSDILKLYPAIETELDDEVDSQ